MFIAFTMFAVTGCTTNPPEATLPITVFLNEEACINAGCWSCDFITCDYVPEGKSFEEACGKNFRKGWQCVE